MLGFLLLILSLVEYFLVKENKWKYFKQIKYIIYNIKYNFNDNPKEYFAQKDLPEMIFFGDSFTVGLVCAAEKKDFVNVVKPKIESDYKYKVFNFASVARGPADYLLLYDYFKHENLKRIIVVLNYNDIELTLKDCETLNVLYRKKLFKKKIDKCKLMFETETDRYQGGILKSIDNFFERTKTWQFIRSKLYAFSLLRKYYGKTSLIEIYKNQEGIEYSIYLDLLKKIEEETRKDNIKLDFVYFPDTVYLSDKNEKVWENFINFAKNNDILIHNSWDYFIKNSNSLNMSWSLTDYHPSCKAHNIFANYLIKEVI